MCISGHSLARRELITFSGQPVQKTSLPSTFNLAFVRQEVLEQNCMGSHDYIVKSTRYSLAKLEAGSKLRRPSQQYNQSSSAMVVIILGYPVIIVPTPSSVSSSMSKEWFCRPSIICVVCTPCAMHLTQQSTLQISNSPFKLCDFPQTIPFSFACRQASI